MFTQPSVAYQLSAEVKWPSKGSLTLDASSTSGAAIKAAPGSRIISTGKRSKLVVVGLEMTGGFTVTEESGGAVSVGESSSFKAVDSSFKNNVAGAGGAVFVQPGSTFKATRSEFFNNTAILGGALHASKDVNFRITDSVFKSNTASGLDGFDVALGGAVQLGYASGKHVGGVVCLKFSSLQ